MVLDFANFCIVIQCFIFLVLKAAIQQSDVIFTKLFWYSVTHYVIISTSLMIIYQKLYYFQYKTVIPTMLLQYQ